MHRTTILLTILTYAFAGNGALLEAGDSTDPFPWTGYEAETATTNATVHGPSRRYLTPESEASGRSYVRLDEPGDYVEFTLTKPADAMVVRYCLPDAADGGGLEASLSVAVDGHMLGELAISSRYAWVYGGMPWSNDPGQGNAHAFFDEVRMLIGEVIAGSTVRLQWNGAAQADYCLIDFAEFECVPLPLPRPDNSLSLTDFGAVPDDDLDDSQALRECLAKAALTSSTVWIPPGKFLLLDGRMDLPGVTLFGAGVWHSVLAGRYAQFEGTGKPVTLADIAIFGDMDYRNDSSPDNAFNGNFGEGSLFKNLWIEHQKCAFWTLNGTRNLRLINTRMRNLMADAVNFCDGTSGSTVEACHIRNTGDDALASWSPTGDWSSKQPCAGNKFAGNRIEQIWHANGIGIYGGVDHMVLENDIRDTVYSGAGILISSNFGAVPLSGTIEVRDNRIEGTGGKCYIGEAVGGIWIHAADSDISARISCVNNRIYNSAASGISIHGPKRIDNLHLRHNTVNGARGWGIEAHRSAKGKASFAELQVSNTSGGLFFNRAEGMFTLVEMADDKK